MSLKKIKNYVFILPLIFFLFFSLGPKVEGNFSFVESTGLGDTAKGTGHTDQKIFNSAESLDFGAGIIVNLILSFVGVVFMVLLIFGGILWMTAGGNEQRVDKAKSTITRAIIGLAVVLLAYAISILIVTAFSGSLS
jgi:hypothetical protein